MNETIYWQVAAVTLLVIWICSELLNWYFYDRQRQFIRQLINDNVKLARQVRFLRGREILTAEETHDNNYHPEDKTDAQ